MNRLSLTTPGIQTLLAVQPHFSFPNCIQKLRTSDLKWLCKVVDRIETARINSSTIDRPGTSASGDNDLQDKYVLSHACSNNIERSLTYAIALHIPMPMLVTHPLSSIPLSPPPLSTSSAVPRMSTRSMARHRSVNGLASGSSLRSLYGCSES